MNATMTIAEIREAFEQACERHGVDCGKWDVAQSRSSYTIIRVPGHRWSEIRVADHIALNRSLSGKYGIEIIADTSEKVAANIEASLSRFVAVHIEASRTRAEDEQRIADRAGVVQAEIERRGLGHLTGEARKALRKEIIREIANV